MNQRGRIDVVMKQETPPSCISGELALGHAVRLGSSSSAPSCLYSLLPPLPLSAPPCWAAQESPPGSQARKHSIGQASLFLLTDGRLFLRHLFKSWWCRPEVLSYWRPRRANTSWWNIFAFIDETWWNMLCIHRFPWTLLHPRIGTLASSGVQL